MCTESKRARTGRAPGTMHTQEELQATQREQQVCHAAPRQTLRATPMASCRLRSTSFKTSLEAPRSTMEQALGSCGIEREW